MRYLKGQRSEVTISDKKLTRLRQVTNTYIYICNMYIYICIQYYEPRLKGYKPNLKGRVRSGQVALTRYEGGNLHLRLLDLGLCRVFGLLEKRAFPLCAILIEVLASESNMDPYVGPVLVGP